MGIPPTRGARLGVTHNLKSANQFDGQPGVDATRASVGYPQRARNIFSPVSPFPLSTEVQQWPSTNGRGSGPISIVICAGARGIASSRWRASR